MMNTEELEQSLLEGMLKLSKKSKNGIRSLDQSFSMDILYDEHFFASVATLEQFTTQGYITLDFNGSEVSKLATGLEFHLTDKGKDLVNIAIL